MTERQYEKLSQPEREDVDFAFDAALRTLRRRGYLHLNMADPAERVIDALCKWMYGETP